MSALSYRRVGSVRHFVFFSLLFFTLLGAGGIVFGIPEFGSIGMRLAAGEGRVSRAKAVQDLYFIHVQIYSSRRR